VVGAAACAVVLVAFAAPLRSEFRYAIFPQDEGLLLVYPSLMLHGAVANRSFGSVYGVVNLWTIAAAFKIAGYSVTVERWVGIAYRLVIVASLFVLVWRHRGVVAGLAAGVISSILMVGTFSLAAYAWLDALALAGIAFVVIDAARGKAGNRPALIVSGAFFGLVLGSRLDLGVSVALVFAVLVVTRRSCIPWFTLGLVIGVVPLLVNVVQAGAGAVIENQIVQPIFVSGPGRRLPLSTLNGSELALMVICFAVACATVISGAVLFRRHRDQWEPVLLLALGGFEIGLLPQAYQRSDTSHLSLVGCFILPAALLLPAWRLRAGPWLSRVNWTALVAGVLILLLARPFFGNLYWSETKTGNSAQNDNYISNEGRRVPVASATGRRQLTALLKVLDARAHRGQRVFVGPLDLRTSNYNDTYIYFLLPQLTPGSFYLEMNPGVANAKDSQLASDLERDDYLILTSSYDDMADPDSSTRYGPNAPNEVVAHQFEAIDTQGPWTLYDRRPQPR